MKPTYSTAYNNTTQTVTAVATDVNILGTIANSNGCINTVTNGFKVLKSGLYRISYDVTFTPTGAGPVILQMYKDSIALPCATSTTTATASSIFTTHIETTIPISSCCAIRPLIKSQISGVAGGINHVCANIIKVGDCS